MKILLATTNKAKIRYYGSKLKECGIDIATLNDVNIDYDVDETGKNPIESVPNEIQQGTPVRRFNGKRLNDEEMIRYYIDLLNQYGTNGKLVAIVYKNSIYTFDYKANCILTNRQSQVIESLNKFKSELTEEEEKVTIDIEQQDIVNFILDTVNTIKEEGIKKLIK